MSLRIQRKHVYHTGAINTMPTPSGGHLPDEFQMYEHLQPAREGNFHSDVLVPVTQAFITGVLAGLIAALLVHFFFSASLDVTAYTFGTAFILIMAGVWGRLLDDHNQLLWRVERVTGRDFDGDGQIGEPTAREPEQVVVVVRRPKKDGENVEFLHYGVNRTALEKFARAALHGESLAVNRWTSGGAPFSRSEYENLRAAMTADGLLRTEKGKTVLTDHGREIFEQMSA